MKTLIFDCETTGLLKPKNCDLSEQPKIIEIGGILLENDKIIAEIDQLFDPEEVLSSEITRITGIKNSDLCGKITFGEWIKEEKNQKLFTDVDKIIAHNAGFDIGCLEIEFLRAGGEFVTEAEIFCTVDYYTRYFNKKPTLKQLYQKIVGKKLTQKHRALSDAFALYEILKEDGFLTGGVCN